MGYPHASNDQHPTLRFKAPLVSDTNSISSKLGKQSATVFSRCQLDEVLGILDFLPDVGGKNRLPKPHVGIRYQLMISVQLDKKKRKLALTLKVVQ